MAALCFCIGCRHHKVRYAEQWNMCHAEVHDLVTGDVLSPEPIRCDIMRRPDMPCGPNGTLFQPRHQP